MNIHDEEVSPLSVHDKGEIVFNAIPRRIYSLERKAGSLSAVKFSDIERFPEIEGEIDYLLDFFARTMRDFQEYLEEYIRGLSQKTHVQTVHFYQKKHDMRKGYVIRHTYNMLHNTWSEQIVNTNHILYLPKGVYVVLLTRDTRFMP